MHSHNFTRPIRWLALIGVLGAASVASAAPGKIAFKPGFGVHPDVTAAFDKQRSEALTPQRAAANVTIKSTSRIVARLAAFQDGVVLLAIPVNSARQGVLRTLGASEVETKQEVRSHCLFNGEYYRAYDARGLAAGAFTPHVGKKVRVQVVRTHSGGLYISGITGA